MKTVDQIVAELYEIEPGLRPMDSELRKIVSEFLASKPDTKFDENFARKLRMELLESKMASMPSPFWSAFDFSRVAVLGGGVLAVVAMMIIFGGGGDNSGLAFNQNFNKVQDGSFGPLSGISSAPRGLGGGGSELNAAPMAAQDSGIARGISDTGSDVSMKMMYPAGPITRYSYVYKGDDFSVPGDSVTVYKRVTGPSAGKEIASELKSMNLGLLDLRKFAGMKLRNFTISEDKAGGYDVYVNFDEGAVSISKNYGPRGMDVNALNQSDMPSNSQVIAIAEKFLKDYGINRANYGDAIVDDFWNRPTGPAEIMPAYYPETVTVVFPLKVKGENVYEEGGYPYGVQVGVSVTDKKVVSLYNLFSQTFQSSNYGSVTDKQEIINVLERGGSRAYVYIPEGAEVTKVTVEVGTPERILLHFYSYQEGESKELFVPALKFPVTKIPADYYGAKFVIVPLASELLKQSNDPILYMKGGGVAPAPVTERQIVDPVPSN